MSAMFRLNGEATPFEAITVKELLERLGISADARGAAVAINGAVVPRRDWHARQLAANDEVDVVRPFAGG